VTVIATTNPLTTLAVAVAVRWAWADTQTASPTANANTNRQCARNERAALSLFVFIGLSVYSLFHLFSVANQALSEPIAIGQGFCPQWPKTFKRFWGGTTAPNYPLGRLGR
jgi:hypothetical protein